MHVRVLVLAAVPLNRPPGANRGRVGLHPMAETLYGWRLSGDGYLELPGTFRFELGAEWAPDSPSGLDIFELDPDGRFRCENRQRGTATTREGQASTAVFLESARALHEAGFPVVAVHPIPPGAGLFRITKRREQEQTAFMHEHAARRFPGYCELVRRIDEWTNWLRGSTAAVPPGGARSGVNSRSRAIQR